MDEEFVGSADECVDAEARLKGRVQRIRPVRYGWVIVGTWCVQALGFVGLAVVWSVSTNALWALIAMIVLAVLSVVVMRVERSARVVIPVGVERYERFWNVWRMPAILILAAIIAVVFSTRATVTEGVGAMSWVISLVGIVCLAPRLVFGLMVIRKGRSHE